VSAGIIYGLPPAPPLPPGVPVAVKTSVLWTGWDGSEWDLTDPDGGVVLVNSGVEGLHMPKFKQWTRQSPAVNGQTFTGMVAEPRDVVLPLLVFEDTSSLAWVEHDRRFWRSLHPAREGVLTVAPAGIGGERTLRLRLVPDNHSYPIDPALARWAQYVVQMVADQPFWAGRPVIGSWKSPVDQEFYEETGPQLVNINSGHTTANAAIENEGDEDAWPVWTIIGPAATSKVGIGTKTIDVPFPVADGKALVIDTDPRVQTAIQYNYTPATETEAERFTSPVDRTADLTGAVDFSPIPAGGTRPINVAITGGGVLRVQVTPLFWRAW
jgi:hypothetical protein